MEENPHLGHSLTVAASPPFFFSNLRLLEGVGASVLSVGALARRLLRFLLLPNRTTSVADAPSPSAADAPSPCDYPNRQLVLLSVGDVEHACTCWLCSNIVNSTISTFSGALVIVLHPSTVGPREAADICVWQTRWQIRRWTSSEQWHIRR